MSLLADMKMYGRFAWGLRGFLRRTLSLQEARAIVRRRLVEREISFLRLVKRGIFGYPRSPYLPLLKLATRELVSLGLADIADVEDGVVFRQPKAYPVYDREYRKHLQVIQRFLATIDNLQTIGRNGLHRYNNQDHSMLAGMLAVRNLLGENHDLWNINTEHSYYEELVWHEERMGCGGLT